MASPSGTTGLTRSEAAILAWKKRARRPKPGALDPKIAARVKQILAGKQKKGKAAPKGKKAPDPAKAKAEAEKDKERAAAKQERDKAKAERATAATARKQERDKAKVDRAASAQQRLREATKKKKAAIQSARKKQQDRDKAKSASTAAREKAKADKEKLTKQKQSDQEKSKADREKASQAKQGDKDKAAKEKADTDQGDLLASVADNPKNLGYRQAGELERAGLVEKTKDGYQLTGKGKAKIAARQKKIDAAKSNAGKAMDMSEGIERLPELFEQAGLGTSGGAIKAGARHSKMDASHLDEAARHLHSAGATCPDCAPDDLEDDEELADADAEKAIKGIMDNPAWYAQHECGDVSQACSALQTLAMLIQSELMEEDEDDAHVAMLCDGARTLVKFISAELDELEGAAGDAADNARMGPMNKAINDADWLHIAGGEVKAFDDSDEIKGLAILYAAKSTHDLERDYYDKDTDLWLDHWGWPKPITYHHGMDKDTRADPVVGHWTKAVQTDEGVWLEGQLDRAHRYYKAIKELARRGYLKISSDSGPQWVIREPQSNGANYIKRWPLVTASVTVTPMEPRMLPVEVKALMAEIGLDAIDTNNPEAVKADTTRHDGVEVDQSQARRLLLELELLELETAA